MAKLRLAYGRKEDIGKSITSGKIPPGTMILTEDSNEMYFYNLDCVMRAYKEKNKFHSKEEAESWVSKYNCKGEILSIHENDVYNIYVVDYNNQLRKFETAAESFTQVQADWNEEDPDSPAYIKNKPTFIPGTDSQYVHNQLIPSDVWHVRHSMKKYPAVTIVDSAGSVVIGDVVHQDNSNLILTFRGTFSGVCYCN